MKSSEVTELVGDLASQQWGLFTTAQARTIEVTSPDLLRVERAGILERVRHGVYAIAGTVLSPEIELKAQWLSLRPDMMAADRLRDEILACEAVVSHTTAAELWGIGDLWADGYHFTVPQRRRSRQPEVQFHRADLADDEWQIHPKVGLPVTSAARTIADLADDGHESGHLLSLVTDAGNKHLVGIHELFIALKGKEEAFGLDARDENGLHKLLSECLRTTEIDLLVSKALEQQLQPLRESMGKLAYVIWSDTMMSKEVKAAMTNVTDSFNQSLLGATDIQKQIGQAFQSKWGALLEDG
ncbi:type IV toxin-antitoxin system AbiEi family antitoxin domain-containing protein [Corynebacterium sp. MSK044]|uniref:type IV toxin-antitoxin system AbiEi family antitoxin domain-containing protein n=1 Tax=Corynebacterium sp. MSK044 TaxID=3050195 RepID=UPI00254DFD38|nr:type IV toxin-antitoxin system AbiEi family antitoxin domain-containing protein [Corynebacterium sp. MSK044]MDK8797737.1 type IV toxin-antitoxin system AbiEi family antitoxin domain-containing protein [Corynebacterium sp. MSK044]